MSLRKIAAVLLIPASLAGCIDNAAMSAGPTVAATTTFAPSAADKASAAYKACRAAIANQTGRPLKDVTVFDYLYSEANTQIQARVKGADAPWRCLSSNRGEVAEVMYTGSEGAL